MTAATPAGSAACRRETEVDAHHDGGRQERAAKESTDATSAGRDACRVEPVVACLGGGGGPERGHQRDTTEANREENSRRWAASHQGVCSSWDAESVGRGSHAPYARTTWEESGAWGTRRSADDSREGHTWLPQRGEALQDGALRSAEWRTADGGAWAAWPEGRSGGVADGARWWSTNDNRDGSTVRPYGTVRQERARPSARPACDRGSRNPRPLGAVLGGESLRKRRSKRRGKKRPRRLRSKSPLAGMDPEERAALVLERREELSAARPLEPSCKEKPLLLLGELPSLDVARGAWHEVIADRRLRSWMFVQRGNPAITKSDLSVLTRDIPWESLVSKSGQVTRKTAWMVRKGCQCQYKYGNELVDPIAMPPWMDDIMRRWLQDLDLSDESLPNSVNFNLYDHGGHGVGWHADDEPLFRGKVQDARIISVSLGAARRFRIGMRKERRGGKKKLTSRPDRLTVSDVMLNHGDVCTMEGLFQKHFVHQLAKTKVQEEEDTATRVNATFRWIVNHVHDCPLYVYIESASNSDDDDGSASIASVSSGHSERRTLASPSSASSASSSREASGGDDESLKAEAAEATQDITTRRGFASPFDATKDAERAKLKSYQ